MNGNRAVVSHKVDPGHTGNRKGFAFLFGKAIAIDSYAATLAAASSPAFPSTLAQLVAHLFAHLPLRISFHFPLRLLNLPLSLAQGTLRFALNFRIHFTSYFFLDLTRLFLELSHLVVVRIVFVVVLILVFIFILIFLGQQASRRADRTPIPRMFDADPSINICELDSRTARTQLTIQRVAHILAVLNREPKVISDPATDRLSSYHRIGVRR